MRAAIKKTAASDAGSIDTVTVDAGAMDTVAIDTAARGTASASGELLVLRPGRETHDVVIRHGGRTFRVRPSMAQVFLDRARKVIDAGEAELVPLLHEGGVELLFVNPSVVIGVDHVDGVAAG